MDAQTRTWSKRRPLNYRRGKRQWEAELQMVTETQRREKQKSPNLFRSPTVSMELPLFGFYLGAVSLAKNSPLYFSQEKGQMKSDSESCRTSAGKGRAAPPTGDQEKSWAILRGPPLGAMQTNSMEPPTRVRTMRCKIWRRSVSNKSNQARIEQNPVSALFPKPWQRVKVMDRGACRHRLNEQISY